MAASPGHVELQRTLDSIIVGQRHREDLGDLDPLIESIRREGLLQPITVTPDGLLVCGRRRLEALKELQHRTTNVWVRSGLTDRLSQLLAEQNDNALHKPLSLIEAESLYRELKAIMSEDAERRQTATRFGAPEIAGKDGGANLAPPNSERGKTRGQAARMVTGRNAYTTLERIGRLKDLANDDTQPPHIRATAAEELRRVEASGKVYGSHLRMNTALSLEELTQLATDEHQSSEVRARAAAALVDVRAGEDRLRTEELERLANEAVARLKADKATTRRTQTKPPVATPALSAVKLPPRVFVAMWDDLAGWTRKYDPTVVAETLNDEDWKRFEMVLTETVAFAHELRVLRRGQIQAEPLTG